MTTQLPIQRLAAFTADGDGGNPAGVVLADAFSSEKEMMAIAAEVGFSETVFASRDSEALAERGSRVKNKVSENKNKNENENKNTWRARYFAPEQEVDFCGHATIALGAALGQAHGAGKYILNLNAATISVVANDDGSATLTSPPTNSRALDDEMKMQIMQGFGLTDDDIDPALGTAMVNAGNDHVLLGLKSRARLAAMHYDYDAMRALMVAHTIPTIALAVRDDDVIHVRNAFAFGGVVEDPATGAAAAAIAGYLREKNLVQMEDGMARLTFHQGDDMGVPCRIYAIARDPRSADASLSHDATIPAEPNSGIDLTGFVRRLEK